MPCCGGGGGGGGGRRQEPSRGQQSPVPTFHRGGGRGRGRVGGNQAPPPAAQPAAFSQFESVPAPEASTSLPRVAPHAASASSSVASLSRDVEERLTLQSPAPTQDLPAFTTPSKASRFPPRPGYGTVGRKCVVRANHLLVEVADRDLHHYDVSITPEVASETVNRVVMTELVSLYRESHLGGRMPAFDGRKGLYTAGPLPFTSKEFAVKLADQNGHTDSTRREREFKVAIKFAARADLRHLQQFLLGRQTDSPQETIQILAVVLKESPSKSYTIVGRSFYSSVLGPTGELGDGLEYWKGYYQSLYPTQMGLSLNIDASARSFYEPILVTEFVAKYFNVRELSGPLSDEDRVKIKRALKGVKVEHTHREYANRYKITGVSTQPMSQLTFSLNDTGAPMSVVQYFREKYNIVLKYAFLPALQSGSDTNPIYFPMELCKIVEGQRCSKKMSDKQVTALLRATCQRPDDRERTINQMVRQNSYSRDLLVREEFGIQVRDELTLVDARVLPPPRLKYHDTGKEANVDPQLGQWNMINKKMVNGGTVELWTCVNFSLLLCEDFVVRFCEELVSMCASKGMVFNSNPLLPIHSAHPDQIEEALLNIHSQSTAKLASVGQEGKQLQLLIIILPDVSRSYGRIKRVCETELGIMSQCCQPTQAQKLNKQYLENVALKINVKVGGRNTVLFDALQRQIPLITDLPTIIFGADVTHPQPWDVSSPSIAGVVASMDWPEMTKYRGLVSAQHHRVEIIQDLFKSIRDPQKGMVHGGMVRELLIAFRRSTGHKPHRIIFYRDGVSEGQFSRLLLSEMDAIRQACASLEDGYLPRVTFVVVQKRHNTRLFPGDPNDCNLMDTSGNILPGTVVDTNICHPFEFDFYLNSHAVTQGTSQPTRYRVLYDENDFSADALQTLTNNLCYTYARCTRAVSVVPPVRYAHLAAFRARYYIDGSETSHSGSECGGSSTSDSGSEGWGTGEMNVEVRSLLPIKDNVKDVMFYC